MSKYASATTNINDGEVLIEALQAMGFKSHMIQNHIGNPKELVDFTGQKTKYLNGKDNDKADIIIPRRYVGGAANDLGFARQADGTYSAIISQYDSSKYNNKWLNSMKQTYSEISIAQKVKRAGGKVLQTKDKNGKKVMQVLFA